MALRYDGRRNESRYRHYRKRGPVINEVVRIVLRRSDRTTPSRKCQKLAQRESHSQSRGSYGSRSSLFSSASAARRI